MQAIQRASEINNEEQKTQEAADDDEEAEVADL